MGVLLRMSINKRGAACVFPVVLGGVRRLHHGEAYLTRDTLDRRPTNPPGYTRDHARRAKPARAPRGPRTTVTFPLDHFFPHTFACPSLTARSVRVVQCLQLCRFFNPWRPV